MNTTGQKKGIFKQFYAWCANASDSPRAKTIVYSVAFAESSFFPIPPDIIIIPMMLADPKSAWRLAFWCTVYSVLGGILGYAIGYYLYSSLGEWIIDTYNLETAFDNFQSQFKRYGFWIIALKGLTPIPYKLITIASGVAKFPVLPFMLASLMARSFRFFSLALVFYFFGERAKPFIEKFFPLVLLATLGIIVLGFYIFSLL